MPILSRTLLTLAGNVLLYSVYPCKKCPELQKHRVGPGTQATPKTPPAYLEPLTLYTYISQLLLITTASSLCRSGCRVEPERRGTQSPEALPHHRQHHAVEVHRAQAPRPPRLRPVAMGTRAHDVSPSFKNNDVFWIDF